VKVDARRLSVVLTCSQVGAVASSTLCECYPGIFEFNCICLLVLFPDITEDEAVVLHVALGPAEGLLLGSATYYLPVIVDEEAASAQRPEPQRPTEEASPHSDQRDS
jgi:hypothetical protein